MGVPVKELLSLDKLELSLMVFLTTFFPTLLVADQEAYIDKLGKYRLSAETRAAILVQHDRTEYQTWQTLVAGKLENTFIPTHVFSILFLCADHDEVVELLGDLRASCKHYYPTGMADWCLAPVTEQYEGEIDGLHHYAAYYQLSKSYLPGLAEARLGGPQQ